MKLSPRYLLLLALAAPLAVRGQTPTKSPLLVALEEQVARSRQQLSVNGPYFLGYAVADVERVSLEASDGLIESDQSVHERTLDVDLRMGSPALDNTHPMQREDALSNLTDMLQRRQRPFPIEDDPKALRNVLWLATDDSYRRATERLSRIEQARAATKPEKPEPPDLSVEPPEHYLGARVHAELDTSLWKQRLRNWSGAFNAHPEIANSSVSMEVDASNDFLTNSEGTSTQFGLLHARIMVKASGRAADGMELSRFRAFDTHSVGDLPDSTVVERAVQQTIDEYTALQKAPVMDPYAGPALLSGRAAGVFFHEIFGHRIEGHRQKDSSEGQTFTNEIGHKVLPDFLSVVDDPTTAAIAGVQLNGFYPFDDEGVRAQRVVLVDHGVLKTFLMSRSPVTGFAHSNGHGRRQPGFHPVGRQGNLIVDSSRSYPEKTLRAMLLEECKRQGKPYGLYIAEVDGGFTTTQRALPQAYEVHPSMVYRVYVDGRPDELVRGIDVIGTPLASFSKIVACGDRQETFNGYCGAESGMVPVSAVAPAVLTSQIELQRTAKPEQTPLLLPPPGKDRP